MVSPRGAGWDDSTQTSELFSNFISGWGAARSRMKASPVSET
jgi:hypothetical protein